MNVCYFNLVEYVAICWTWRWINPWGENYFVLLELFCKVAISYYQAYYIKYLPKNLRTFDLSYMQRKIFKFWIHSNIINGLLYNMSDHLLVCFNSIWVSNISSGKFISTNEIVRAFKYYKNIMVIFFVCYKYWVLSETNKVFW